MTGLLPCVEVEPRGPARASVVWLHGLGADGHDFEPIVPELGLPDAVRFVFPHAPVRPVTLNGGWPMRAWFDIVAIDESVERDHAGIEASRTAVEALIAREVGRGVPAGHIVLAGFSQGGAIALHAGLRHAERLAGILALSTFLPTRRGIPQELSAANRDVPILMCHGTSDPIVPSGLGERSRDALRAEGYAVEWKTYTMPHAVCPEEIFDARQWLVRVLMSASTG
jgi:phospholipase/carboxylesterase